jgi:predicted RNase H-related nuclease YkuK (DUF458 family)
MPMALEKMSFVETDWYVTQEETAQARDFIFKDFCDYIIVIKTFADKEDNSKLIRTDVIHINSNNGGVTHKKIEELDPPLLEALEKSGFPVVKN